MKASGYLRVTAPAGFGRRHVAPLVPRFIEQHPDVNVSLNLSDRVVDIVNESYDCAVRVVDLPDSSLISVRLADNRRMCVATPAYLKRAGTPKHPNELLRHECLTLSVLAEELYRVIAEACVQGIELAGRRGVGAHLKDA